MINLELFSCAGGLAEGFRRAGIRFDLAIDRAADHCDSYERNLGHRPVQMDVRELLHMVRLGWRVEVDLLVADPPCTPWSRAGKRRGTADERDMLEVTCELFAALRPRRYLVCNIPGLDDETNLHVVQRTIGALAAHGYCTADFARLDAADYGVPQHRVRPFWFGHRAGPCIRWQPPTHGDPEQLRTATLPTIEPLKPWVTCRDALGHLSAKQLGRPVRMRKRNTFGKQHGSVADRPARVVGTSNLSDGNMLMLDGDRKRAKRPPSTKGHQSERVIDPAGPATTIQGRGDRPGGGSPVIAWPWDRPATTVTSDPSGRQAPAGHHEPSMMSHPNAVLLSELAATILQGFPEAWVWCGKSKNARWQQIGQAVPPAVAEAVARSIAEQDRLTRAAALEVA